MFATYSFSNKMNLACKVIDNIGKLQNTKRAFFICYRKLSTIERSTKAVNEAEKVIGYSTSFLSLRWLLNDEVANIAFNLKKLIGTKHPLINTARELIINKESPSWGLLVLLISKAAGLNKKFSPVECDINAGVLNSQRVLAEVTEMVRTSNIIHKSILNISKNDEFYDDLHFGNKLSLLTGDYLLSTSFRELAGLNCYRVNELVSTCLRDLSEADFIEPRNRQNQPYPAEPVPQKEDVPVPHHFDKDVLVVSEVLGNAKAEWTLRHLLGGASLLGKCCQATLVLAEQPRHLEEASYIFGRNTALALQVRKDITYFRSGEIGPFSLISAPLMFHIQDDVEFYKTLVESITNDDIQYGKIRSIVLSGNGIEKSLELKNEFVNNSLEALKSFPESEAKNALINILETV
ncbi:unnamed protein product [Phyllotreta striolata]|uniref:Decaprenyl-diphosphate synthase subunit 2 n=1 Tax=Phyllotreta striolata TaxID=444603 RepID=A0A9N9TL71_PHYSR|nr:unnamed protein product [Phyllotreta striolata]